MEIIKYKSLFDNHFLYGLQCRYAAEFGGGEQSVETIDPYAGIGQKLYKTLGKTIRSQIGQGVEAYPGQIVAGPSSLQQTGFGIAGEQIPSAATGALQYFQDVLGMQAAGGDEYQKLAGTTLQSLMQPWNPQAETEMWNKTFVNPAMQTWQQQIVPEIMERYGEGGVGGALGRELGYSGRDLATNLSGQLANLLYTGQQAQLGRQQTGVNQAMNMSQLPGQILGQASGIGTDLLNQLINIGTVQRGIKGEQLQEPYQKWLYSQSYNNPWLNYLGSIIGQQPLESYMLQEPPSIFSQLLPIMGQAGGTAAGMGLAAAV